MSNLKTIDGGKKQVQTADVCPHCGSATVEFHPAFSCPRITQVCLDDMMLEQALYLDAPAFEKFKKKYPERFNLLQTD